MPRAKNIAKGAGVFMAGALVVMSVAHLFALRFESGDVYPAYSTLRADPLGARAYFEALERLPGLTVERNLRPLPRLRLDEPATLFVLGMDRWAFDNVDEREAREAEHLASLGGRVVVAFAPSYGVIGGGPAFGRRFAPPPQPTPVSPFAPPAPQDSATSSPLELIAASVANKTTSATATAMSTPAGGKNISEDAPDFMAGKIVSLGERWGVKLIHAPFPTDKDGRAGWVEARRSHDAPHDLPAMLHWHSAIAFAPDDERWRPIYARGETPVAMERPWGRGTIVLISDSYYFSNEAARQDRQPEWLAWAAGSPARLIFNETQHGLLQEPGIMGLAREYRLEGALISLLALALLFVWRNASSLVPRGAGDAEGKRSGAKPAAGTSLAHLLRRHIPPGEILKTCFAEWRESPGTEAKAKSRRDNVALMESIVYYENDKPVRARDTVGAYREMARILHERRVRRDPDPR